MKDRLLKQAKRGYSPAQRLTALGLEAVIFIIILPVALDLLSSWLEGLLGLQRGISGWLQNLIGVVVVTAGWLLGAWSIYAQFTRGRGTPVPVMATQQLVITPPYAYSRNPMALGAIIMYLGVAVFIGSWIAAALVLLGAAVLLVYIKLIEEQEMMARFGKDYEIYRRHTPFIVPRFTRWN